MVTCKISGKMFQRLPTACIAYTTYLSNEMFYSRVKTFFVKNVCLKHFADVL